MAGVLRQSVQFFRFPVRGSQDAAGQNQHRNGLSQNILFASAATLPLCGLRNPHRNAAEKADVFAIRSKMDGYHDRVADKAINRKSSKA